MAKDAAAGKATLVSLMGLEAARAELARVEQAAIDAVSLFGARAGDAHRSCALRGAKGEVSVQLLAPTP